MWLGPVDRIKSLIWFQSKWACRKKGLHQLSHIPLGRATLNQILHLRDWLCFEALFSDLRCCLCRGFIALENKTFIIEPVSGHDNGAHFIYRVEELKLTPGACGHGFNMSSVAPENHIKSPFQSFHTRVRLVLCCLFYPKACIRAFGYHSSKQYCHQFEHFL